MSVPLRPVFHNSATSYTAASDSSTGQPTLFTRFSLVLEIEIPALAALVELLSKTAKGGEKRSRSLETGLTR